jgi:chromosome partitioning protein
MEVIVFANQKGGVSKTTSVKTVNEYAANILNKRVLLIDLDPQCNLSRRYMTMKKGSSVDNLSSWVPIPHPDYDPTDPNWEEVPEGRVSSASIYLLGGTDWYPTRFPNIKIIPADGALLNKVERVTEEDAEDKVVSQLKLFLDTFKDEFDYCFIDTSPQKGPLVQSALRASTHVVIPCQMEELSMDGIDNMLGIIENENWSRKKKGLSLLEIAGILPTQYEENISMHAYFLSEIKTGLAKDYVLNNKMHKWVDYKDSCLAVPNAQSIFELPASKKSRKEAEAISQEILDRVDGVN